MEISRIYKSEETGNGSILYMVVRWNDAHPSTWLRQKSLNPTSPTYPAQKQLGMAQRTNTGSDHRDGLRSRLYHLQPV